MQSYRAGYGRMSLLPPVLTHYIRYYGINPADDLCVTYCDSRKPSHEAIHITTWIRQVGTMVLVSGETVTMVHVSDNV
jgi:hypothetical protein